jgi:hypothetical protein
MQIEILEQTEITVNGPEDISKAEQLSTQLEMHADSKRKFAIMKGPELWAYRYLFGKQVPYKEFNSEYVPLRILELIAREKDNYMLEIWSVPDQVVHDPILVGVRELDKYTKEYSLLARWGDALVPFSELYERAIKMRRTELRDEILVAKRKILGLFEDLDQLSNKKIQGMSISCYASEY